MNLPLPVRRAALAATTGALALGLTGTASAAVTAAYDFDRGDLTPSYTENAADATIMGLGGATDAEFAAGQGYSVPTVGISPDSYTVALRFSFSPVDPNGPAADGWLRVIDFSGGESDAGLYLHDGKLAWKNADGTIADEGDASLDTNHEQIVVTRSGSLLQVFREGATEADLEVIDPDEADPTKALVLFDDGEGDEEGSGEITRLRTFSDPVFSGATLSPLDVTGPTEFNIGDGHGTYVDGSTLWLGAFGGVSGSVNDDGTGPLEMDAAIDPADPDADWLDPTSTYASATATADESIQTFFNLGFDVSSLAEDTPYTLYVGSRDKARHWSDTTRTIRIDRTAPTGLTIDTPAETDDRTPAIGGSATVGARDDDTVWASICKGSTCDQTEDDYVGFVSAKISDGKWGSDTIVRQNWDTGEEVPVGELPVGEYTIAASQSDRLFNYAGAETTFKVVEPASVIPADTPPPVVITPPAPRELLTPAALISLNGKSIVASLLKEGLKGLTKDGKASVNVSVDRPATVYVQLWNGGAPAKVRAAAKKAGKLIGSGSKRFAAPGDGKLTVKLSKRGKKLLKGKRSRKVTVRTIIKPVGGSTIAQTKKVTLKR